MCQALCELRDRNEVIWDRRHTGAGILSICLVIVLVVNGWTIQLARGAEIQGAVQPAAPAPPPPLPPEAYALSIDQAVALFLQQNLDVLMAQFGIESAKGQEITSRLLPNPVLNIWAYTSFTQGHTLARSTEIGATVQQLFEVANKRGYRIESAQFATHAAEANFTDTLRQLTFAVKDAYFRVKASERHLTLAQENLARFQKLLEINAIRYDKGAIAWVDLIRTRMQVLDFQNQLIQAMKERMGATTDLRLVLSLSPATPLELTTDLQYRRLDVELDTLHRIALDFRPDIRMKRFALSQSGADWRLARAARYPDPSFGPGMAVQGATGPDNQQMYFLSLSMPLLVFNRNQGGIAQAAVGIRTAEADLRKTLLQVGNDVEIAYFTLIENRRLVEVFQKGVVDDAQESFKIIETAYRKGGATIVDLLDAARTAANIQGNYIDALVSYQHNVFQLESAVGRELALGQ